MLRRLRELISLFFAKLAAWFHPGPEVSPVDEIEKIIRKELVDAATVPVPDRSVDFGKVTPVVVLETDEQRAALQAAIKTADPFEEDISKAIIDALKSEEPKKETATEDEE